MFTVSFLIIEKYIQSTENILELGGGGGVHTKITYQFYNL